MTTQTIFAVPASYVDGDQLKSHLVAVTKHDWSQPASANGDIVDFLSQSQPGANSRMRAVACVYVDNRMNTSAVLLNIPAPQNTISIAPGAQGNYPVFMNGLQQISVVNVSGSNTGSTQLTWAETERGLNVWQSGVASATQAVSDANLEAAITKPAGGNPSIRVVLDTASGDTGVLNPQYVAMSLGNAALSYGNSMPVVQSVGGNAASPTNPSPVGLSTAGATVTYGNPLPVAQSVGGNPISYGNPNPVGISVGGNAAQATNPMPVQLSYGNAALALTNALPVNVTVGGAVIGYSNPAPVNLAANVYGGGTFAKVISAATTNLTLVSTGKHKFMGLELYNSNMTTTAYIHFYDSATVPVVGTSTVTGVIAIPPGQSRSVSFTVGVNFQNGLAYSITGGYADTDTTAVTAGQVVGTLFYY